MTARVDSIVIENNEQYIGRNTAYAQAVIGSCRIDAG